MTIQMTSDVYDLKQRQLRTLKEQKEAAQLTNEGYISRDGPDGFLNNGQIAAYNTQIERIQFEIANAEIVEFVATDPSIVEKGDTVLLQFDEDPEVTEVKIVCPTASDTNGYVASDTPLAQAILGCSVGDKATYWVNLVDETLKVQVTIVSIINK